jgi:hypothetical protein
MNKIIITALALGFSVSAHAGSISKVSVTINAQKIPAIAWGIETAPSSQDYENENKQTLKNLAESLNDKQIQIVSESETPDAKISLTIKSETDVNNSTATIQYADGQKVTLNHPNDRGSVNSHFTDAEKEISDLIAAELSQHQTPSQQ